MFLHLIPFYSIRFCSTLMPSRVPAVGTSTRSSHLHGFSVSFFYESDPALGLSRGKMVGRINGLGKIQIDRDQASERKRILFIRGWKKETIESTRQCEATHQTAQRSGNADQMWITFGMNKPSDTDDDDLNANSSRKFPLFVQATRSVSQNQIISASHDSIV